VVGGDAGTDGTTPPVDPATGSGVRVGAPSEPACAPEDEVDGAAFVDAGAVTVDTGAMVGRADRSCEVVPSAAPVVVDWSARGAG
jgi:hypothetical protein